MYTILSWQSFYSYTLEVSYELYFWLLFGCTLWVIANLEVANPIVYLLTTWLFPIQSCYFYLPFSDS